MLLIGKNIILRQIQDKDLAYIHSKASEYNNVSKYFTTYVKSENYWQKRFEETGLWDDDYGMMVICLKETEEIVGVIYYFKQRYVAGLEISITILDQEIRGKYINLEAVKIFTAYLFSTYDIPRVQFNTLADISKDKGHLDFAKQIGYTYEGTMRKAQYIRGKYVDLQLFSALKEEYQSLEEVIK